MLALSHSSLPSLLHPCYIVHPIHIHTHISDDNASFELLYLLSVFLTQSGSKILLIKSVVSSKPSFISCTIVPDEKSNVLSEIIASSYVLSILYTSSMSNTPSTISLFSLGLAGLCHDTLFFCLTSQ